MGLSREEYWSGLPCLPLGDIPDPGTELSFPAWAGVFFINEFGLKIQLPTLHRNTDEV